MIPVMDTVLTPTNESVAPTKTYNVILDKSRIHGYTDDVEALIQTIYFILNVERYKHIIYSWNYGVELFDLFGKQMPYVKAEVKRRIWEALIQDDRILDVTNFEFEENGSKLHVTFDVISIYGTVQASKEVFETISEYQDDRMYAKLSSNGTLYFNKPVFYSDGKLLFNDLPTLNEEGTLIFN